MKNIIVLQKQEDGTLYCSQITKTGIESMKEEGENPGFWDDGGSITFEEIEEILNKDIDMGE